METLFYLGPPYWGSEGDYGNAIFGRDQCALMAERLAQLKGRFILSINDVPETRGLFDRFELAPVAVDYSVAGGKPKKAGELIVQGGRR